MTTRERLVLWAQEQVGSSDRAAYWLAALGYDPGKKKHWCGAFWLAGLHAVGLALDHKWGIDGTGVQALRMPRTSRPEPGDLGYIDQPFQHHFMVETVGEHTYSSIDGNAGTPGVQRKSRAFKTTGVAFYSIAALVGESEPPQSKPVLRLGSQGPDVKRLQEMLIQVGYPALKVDGSFGPITANVVMQFQRRAGLQPDTVVGKYTWAALERAMRNE